MGKRSKTERRCYLCGRTGADSKDHVPPKCLLPRPEKTYRPRLTLAAHHTCNASYAKDEEYLRDLIGPTTQEFPDGSHLYDATQRAWQRAPGARRLKMILQGAKLVSLRSPAGLYLGRAIGVKPNLERLKRVGIKIARGIIFNDLRECIAPGSLTCAPIPTSEVRAERSRELARSNPYWLALGSAACLHDNYGQAVACRRCYVLASVNEHITCTSLLLLMIYTQSFVVIGEVTVATWPPDLKLLTLNEDVGES